MYSDHLNAIENYISVNSSCKDYNANLNMNYQIADVVGAFLMMDMAHISGLVAASCYRLHPMDCQHKKFILDCQLNSGSYCLYD